MLRTACAALALMILGALPASADGYRMAQWTDLAPQIFGAREVLPAGPTVTLTAPTRSANDARVPVEVAAWLTDGTEVRSVTLIIDGNPMPVSAVFTLAEPRARVRFGITLRFDRGSPLRAVIETTDGRLLMAEQLVKTSGLGTCSAPPIGDPDEAIAKIGQMQAAAHDAPAGQSAPRMVELAMSHPQHTGMQMDQITLHYILARYIDEVQVSAGGEALFGLTGSISIAEDPAVTFELLDMAADRIQVRMQDTSGTVIERDLALYPEG